MTEPTDDGWPDEYRDPRDRPHPDVLRVTVEPFDELREDALDVELVGGDPDEEHAPA